MPSTPAAAIPAARTAAITGISDGGFIGTGYPGSTGGSNTGGNSGYPGGTDGSNTGGTGTGGTTTPGHWDVTYSNQNATTSWHSLGSNNTVQSGSYDWPAASSGDTIPSNTYLDAKTKGQVTAHLKWVPTTGQDAASDPPSDSVIVAESGSAGEMGGGSGKGTADDGWGDSSAPAWPRGGTSDNSAYSSGTHYEVVDGSSGDITVGPFTLSAGTPDNVTPDPSGYFSQAGATLVVGLSIAAYPVIITLDGTVKNKNDNKDNILLGQGCTAHLTIPLYQWVAQSNWSWAISGNKFQDYEVAEDLTVTPHTSSTTFNDNSSVPLDQMTAHWYWSDKAADQTTKCTAKVPSPSGLLTVKATKTIKLRQPDDTLTVTPGRVQINSLDPNTSGLSLWAGGVSSARGFDLVGTVTTPALFSGAGGWNVVQITHPGRWRTLDDINGVAQLERPWSLNPLTGLDKQFPYDPTPTVDTTTSQQAPGHWSDGAFVDTGDSPGFIVANAYKHYRVSESFDTYVMYLPPGSDVRWVPLKKTTWSWSADVTRPGTSWSLWKDSPDNMTTGTVTTPALTRQTDHPQWQQLITVPTTSDGW